MVNGNEINDLRATVQSRSVCRLYWPRLISQASFESHDVMSCHAIRTNSLSPVEAEFATFGTVEQVGS